MSASRTIIEVEDRLDNVHPGYVLREDFLLGSEIPVDETVAATGVSRDRLLAVLAGALPIDADLDFRLTRYFGVSEGILLRLQNAYDLEEAWRAHGEEFDRIPRRAA